MSIVGVNLSCPINSLGYGVVGTNLALEMSKLTRVSLWPIGQMDYLSEHAQTFQQLQDNSCFFDPYCPSLRVYHQFSLAEHIGSGPRLAMPIFELDRFRPQEKHHLKAQDKLLVNSQWAKGVIEREGIGVKVDVVPLGVDSSIFFPANTPRTEGSPTTFLNVGKWEYRKGHDVICEAFNKAFELSDNVRLVMNCYNPCFTSAERRDAYNTQWVRCYSRSKLSSKIEILSERLPTQHAVADLMRSADCGVFPARAEGWNLDLLEMMACGKPVIATNYSAHTEFCTAQNCFLLHVTRQEDAFDGVWFSNSGWDGPRGQWAHLGSDQIDQLVEHMRSVHSRIQDGGLLNMSGIQKGKELSWTRTASLTLQSLQ